jgi:CBS domain-containing protein
MEIRDAVRAVLNRKGSEVWSIDPQESVYRAIEIMAEKYVGALLVMSDGKLVGIVSERDYARKVILKGKSSKETRVSEIMTSAVITVNPDQPIDACLRIITEKHIRHLPVVEGDAVIGVVSIGDLVNWIMSAQGHAIQQLENYVTGRYPYS